MDSGCKDIYNYWEKRYEFRNVWRVKKGWIPQTSCVMQNAYRIHRCPKREQSSCSLLFSIGWYWSLSLALCPSRKSAKTRKTTKSWPKHGQDLFVLMYKSLFQSARNRQASTIRFQYKEEKYWNFPKDCWNSNGKCVTLHTQKQYSFIKW